jgi:hypothetical protein
MLILMYIYFHLLLQCIAINMTNLSQSIRHQQSHTYEWGSLCPCWQYPLAIPRKESFSTKNARLEYILVSLAGNPFNGKNEIMRIFQSRVFVFVFVLNYILFLRVCNYESISR